MDEPLPRKLTAIMHADIAGYSRLTEEDEEGTFRTVHSHLQLVSKIVAQHGGRVVKFIGDAILSDFGSVVNAVCCAESVQRAVAQKNKAVPENRRILFRIGINLGDVIVDGDDIHGEGVNVAARLEGLAEPGDVCISDVVRNALGNKLDLHYKDIGEQELKNIPVPVRCYRILIDADPGSESRQQTSQASSPVEAEEHIPTIAIVPFTFIGEADGHGYIADALTTSTSSALAHFRDYRIIDGDDKAMELADYRLSASLQVAGPKIRITPQLSRVVDGQKIWATIFDRRIDDVFALQDEISAIIAAYLGEAIWKETARALSSKNPQDYSAIDWIYYAMECLHRLTPDDCEQARIACKKALQLDPESLFARRTLAFVLSIQYGWKWSDNLIQTRDNALELTTELLRTDPDHATVHRMASRLYSFLRRHDEALAHSKRALSLNPFDGDILITHGMTLLYFGYPDEAILFIEKALRYNPQPPAFYLQTLMAAHYFSGNHTLALENLHDIEGDLLPQPRVTAIAILKANGLHEEAARAARELLKIEPETSLNSVRSLFINYKNTNQVEMIIEVLRDVGIRESAQHKNG